MNPTQTIQAAQMNPTAPDKTVSYVAKEAASEDDLPLEYSAELLKTRLNLLKSIQRGITRERVVSLWLIGLLAFAGLAGIVVVSFYNSPAMLGLSTASWFCLCASGGFYLRYRELAARELNAERAYSEGEVALNWALKFLSSQIEEEVLPPSPMGLAGDNQ